MKAMIFAAGLGTRLQSITSNKPKALVEVAGVPLLEHAILYLKSFGVTEIVINVHHFADQIIKFLQQRNNFGITIHISDESNLLLDTGGGLKKAKHYLQGDEPIVLVNVDIISNLDLNKVLDYHFQEKALATLVVRKRETQRYLVFDTYLNLCGWKNVQTGEVKQSNKRDTANEMYAFSGIHIIQPELLKLITEEGKFSMIDLYLRLAINHHIKAFIDTSDLWFDLGKPEQLTEAETIIRKYRIS